MSSSRPRWPSDLRRCVRCPHEAVVVVAADRRTGVVAACAEHMEWAFLSDVEQWCGRDRAA